MFNDSDDDDFSVPTPRSNLAVLFTSKNFDKKADPSLTYVAPKQPQKKVEETTTLFCAKVVIVVEGLIKDEWKHSRFGLAIIGNENLKVYEMILYKTKQDIKTRVKITESFNFSIQDYVFGTFHDKNCLWVVKFKEKEDILDFCAKLTEFGAGITKTNTNNSISMFSAGENYQNPSDDVKLTKNAILKNNLVGDYKTEQRQFLNDMNKLGVEVTSYEAEKKREVNLKNKIGVKVLPTLSGEIEEKNDSIQETQAKNEEKLLKNEANSISQYSVTSREKSDVGTESSLSVQQPQSHFVQNLHFTASSNLPPIPDSLTMLATEARLASSETRFSLAQIQLKIDQLINAKMNTKKNGETNEALQSKIKVLILKIENMEEEMKKLREENEKKVKQSRNDAIEELNKQEIIEILERENKELKDENMDLKLQVFNAEKEVEISKEEKKNTFKLLEENQNISQDNMRLQNKVKNLENQIDKYKELEEKLKQLEEIVENKEKQSTEVKSKQLINNADDKVQKLSDIEKQTKDLMNQMYQRMINSNSEIVSPITEEFKPILVKYIKNTTFKIIENVKSKFD